MSHFDLFGLRGETGCDLFRTASIQESGVKALLELQAAPCDAGRISGLPGRPAVLISWLESSFRVPGLSGFEFRVFFHSIIQSGLHKRERCRRKANAWKRRRAEFGPLPGRADQVLFLRDARSRLVSIVPRSAAVIWKTLIRRGVADSGIRNRNAQVI